MNESQKGLFIAACCIMFLTMPICVLPLEVQCSQFHCLCPGVDASRDSMPGIETCKIPQALQISLGWRGLVGPGSFEKYVTTCDFPFHLILRDSFVQILEKCLE